MVLYNVIVNSFLQSPLAKVVDTKGRSKNKWRPQALDTVVCINHS